MVLLPHSSPPGQRSPSPRVLFVDDDPVVRRAFARTLVKRGFLVDVAADGNEALALAAQTAYPVVATDLVMPGMDGVTLIRRLRELQPGATFVIVTGRPHVELPGDADLSSIVTSVVTKPWDEEDLVETLVRAGRLFEARHSLAPSAPGDSADEQALLLVEDDDADADLVAFYVAAKDRQNITRVRRLDEAVALLATRSFGLILCDLSLPDARGLDTVLRLQAASPAAPLVVLTGLQDENLAIEAVQSGAQDYLAKDELSASSLQRAIRYARERKRAELRLAQLAHFDSLTGLANRTLFGQRLSYLLSRSRRSGAPFAVMFIDLDKFKPVNDQYGHAAGDLVLSEVARRLGGVLREYDTVARLGGDEFAALLDDLSGPADAEHVAQRILSELRKPVPLSTGQVEIGASIGIATYPLAADDADGLLKAADKAMYWAKRGGRDCFRVYAKDHRPMRAPSVRFATELHRALERSQFELYYQPLFACPSQRLRGAEALLRWHRDGHGVVMPGEFLGSLEESGDIVAVGSWVLDAACAQLQQLLASGVGDLVMTINLSTAQLYRGELVPQVAALLEKYGLPAGSLELEVTEQLLIQDAERALSLMQGLNKLGVRLAIDDFGTGYSCLAQLHRLPVHSIKVDRTFVQNVGVSAEAEAVTRTIISLGKQLGLEVVVEGIETAEQYAFFEAEQCDVLQGYLLGRPGPACEVFERALAHVG